MSDFAISWRLSRQRFVDAIKGLNQDQLNWKMQPDALTIAQMAVHVAGVEVSFSSQLLDAPLDEYSLRIKHAATDGVVNDRPFPFDETELTPKTVARILELSAGMAGPLLDGATHEIREKSLVSALGPVITGEGAFARLAFHAAYHQGQVHLVVTAPGFPR